GRLAGGRACRGGPKSGAMDATTKGAFGGMGGADDLRHRLGRGADRRGWRDRHSLPIAPAESPRRNELSSRRKSSPRPRHHYRLLVRQEISAGKGDGAARFTRYPPFGTALFTKLNRRRSRYEGGRSTGRCLVLREK